MNNDERWERIITTSYETLDRCKVPGGWLYRNMTLSHGYSANNVAMVFVPDAPAS